MTVDTCTLPDQYLPLLDELNAIVKNSGVPLEGNLFYWHHEPNPSRETVFDYFYGKRLNFAAACKASRCMLEIGFNAGHSALLALANGVEYHGVDICQYPYTKPAAEFLKQQFGERFHFYEGSSLNIIPEMPIKYPFLRFDLIHVDGNHHPDVLIADTVNSLKMALKNGWLIIDDTDLPHVMAYYDELTQQGTLHAVAPSGWQSSNKHAIGAVA